MRVALFLAGVVVTAGALLGFLAALDATLTAASPPNALEGNAFCCASPAAWGEVPGNIGVALLVVAVDSALWVAASWLFTAKVRWQWLLRTVVGSVAVALVVVAGSLATGADDAVVAPRCDGYAFDRAAFLSGDRSSRRVESLGIARCGILRDRTRAQVRALLGAPDDRTTLGSDDTYWEYGQLHISFDAGRVTSVDIFADPGFDMS